MARTGDPDEKKAAEEEASRRRFYSLSASQKEAVMAEGKKQISADAIRRRRNSTNIETDDNVKMKKTFKNGAFSGYAPKSAKDRIQQTFNRIGQKYGEVPSRFPAKKKPVSEIDKMRQEAARKARSKEDELAQAIARRRGRASGGANRTLT